MPPTIYDIADHADVSTATVSRVLNEEGGVAADTRSEVLEAADELGYRPHASAQNLARKRTHAISVVLPVLANQFYMGVLRGIQDSLASTPYDLLVYAPSHPDNVQDQVEQAAQRGRSDGLLLISAPAQDGILEALETTDQEVVLVDTSHPDYESIVVDNRQGGYKATRHLLQAGYDRIGHITSDTPEPTPATERRRGYEQALRDAGKPVADELVARGGEEPFAFAKEGGYEAMTALLSRENPPDAVFAASDMQALGALRAASDLDVDIPGDVALIGFDDLDVSTYVGLSTLRQPLHDYGRLAIDKLTTRIKDPGQPASSTVFDPEIVVRSTCGTDG